MEKRRALGLRPLPHHPAATRLPGGDFQGKHRRDAETGEIVRTLTGHEEPVSQVLYLSKEKLLSGSWDRTLRLWDSDDSRVLRGHQSEITALQVNEETLFSASEDGTVRVWPLAGEGEPAVLTGAPASVRCLVVTAEGKLILAGTRGQILGWSRK